MNALTVILGSQEKASSGRQLVVFLVEIDARRIPIQNLHGQKQRRSTFTGGIVGQNHLVDGGASIYRVGVGGSPWLRATLLFEVVERLKDLAGVLRRQVDLVDRFQIPLVAGRDVGTRLVSSVVAETKALLHGGSGRRFGLFGRTVMVDRPVTLRRALATR